MSILNDIFDAISAPAGHHMGRTRYRGAGYKMVHSRSIAQRNRWTGKPHEHKREIARRLRQQEAR